MNYPEAPGKTFRLQFKDGVLTATNDVGDYFTIDSPDPVLLEMINRKERIIVAEKAGR